MPTDLEMRFAGWPASELAAQCRMQARENLDPEYSAFMESVAVALTPPAVPVDVAGESATPDEIDIYRIIKRSGARSHIGIARAIAAALSPATPDKESGRG